MTLSTQPIRDCPHCEDGTLYEDLTTREAVCDTCHTCFGGNDVSRRVRRHSRRSEVRAYERSTYDTGTVRLIGGYEAAYYEENGSEYAIDADESETVLTPHARDWARGGAD